MITMRCHVTTDNLSRALNHGTTLTSRFFIALAAMLQGGGFMLQSPSWLSHPSFQSLNAALPVHTWGGLFMSAGFLGVWRVLSPTSRPGIAWAVNIYVSLVWSLAVCVRFYGTGAISLLSLYTAVLMISLWCTTRTQATRRDTETA